MKRFTLFITAAVLVFSGCKKFVDIKTQGNLVPGEIINYRYLLNNTSAFEYGPQISDMASDDVQLVDGSVQQIALVGDAYNYWSKSYTWQQGLFPFGTSYQGDNNWINLYNAITVSNIVINETPEAGDGTLAEKNALIAEGLVHRANAYLMLVNTYAKPYNASTSTADPGVPLVLIGTTTQSLVRNPVQEVYNQIIGDLKRAIPSLPATQLYNTLPSKPSAYGTLARTYLYMNDYTNAKLYADSVLLTRSTLNDLSTINATTISNTTYPVRRTDPEILLSKIAFGGISAYTPYALRLSDNLLTLLGTTDQRYTLFTTVPATISANYNTAGGRFFFKDRAMGEARNIGPSVPEMMLIEAEYYARNNNRVLAMEWVNRLRIKRFKTADYVALTATSNDDALFKVIEERRREFFCRMTRWWDMRRLKDDARFAQTYTRSFGGVNYTLNASSNGYVFPIAEYLISLNPEIAQNP
ncbi:RagB/SusD family nutrient uptake outer membrane protein [Pedobacter sp. MC2016-14]|uniref:RagB/SusD family nutrient uptake outer membrane protein n=1 Tax=Pedobacter sp. MC2016-14 TaxID=2897327 RepID=UPI001E603501|nr:RagB/SusD family nutrient uptake outer membrane protein [Pedobacter sp. MC2016-14]MCD0490389.1 RagB/SusD family nutrient uptake outer membrane protein [Pedobacter sp. MC2016-14]